jgi:hypothetical protein
MTNFIIILLIFQYIKTLIIGNDKSVLCCGIWGFSSKRKDGWNALSRWKFQTLGVEMDSRGGDGCGIAFDNTVHKSENILKFDEFWRSEYVPNTLKFQAHLIIHSQYVLRMARILYARYWPTMAHCTIIKNCIKSIKQKHIMI